MIEYLFSTKTENPPETHTERIKNTHTIHSQLNTNTKTTLNLTFDDHLISLHKIPAPTEKRL